MNPKQKFLAEVTAEIAALIKQGIKVITIQVTDSVKEDSEGYPIHIFTASVLADGKKRMSSQFSTTFPQRRDDMTPLAPYAWNLLKEEFKVSVFAHLFERMSISSEESSASEMVAQINVT